MSLDPYVHPDNEIQALVQLTGARAWKLWAPGAPPSEVYLTLQMGEARANTKLPHHAPVEQWREHLTMLLDSIKMQQEPA